MEDFKAQNELTICNRIISSEWEKILKREAVTKTDEDRIEYQYYLKADSALFTASMMNKLLNRFTGKSETREEASCPAIILRYEIEAGALLLEFVRRVGESCELSRYEVPFYSEVSVKVSYDGKDHMSLDSVEISWNDGDGNIVINNEYFSFGNLSECHSVKFKL